jgi:hypothetical protein
MPRLYRASIILDYTGSSNEYQYLISALKQLGWTYVETSSLTITTPNRNDIWAGVALVMKQDASIPGPLSALTLHVIGSDDIQNGIPYPYSDTHPAALDAVRNKPYPV